MKSKTKLQWNYEALKPWIDRMGGPDKAAFVFVDDKIGYGARAALKIARCQYESIPKLPQQRAIAKRTSIPIHVLFIPAKGGGSKNRTA